MKQDPISIIKNDHKMVERLFKNYENVGPNAIETKRKIVEQVIQELSVHAEMEESFCYPRFKEALNQEDDKMVEEAYVEHQGVKNLLEDLEALEPSAPEFDATMKVLMEQVKHHVQEEENELLPTIEKEMSEEEMTRMGDEMVEFKETRLVSAK